jgi:hypothetical protein
MGNEFNLKEWHPIKITSPKELIETLLEFDLIGRQIREVWNVGIVFDEDLEDRGMSVELDEPIILVLGDVNLEILFSECSLVHIAKNRLTLKELSYQGVACNQNAQRYLSVILNTPISNVAVIKTSRDDVDNPMSLKLPDQDELIDTVVLKFKTGFTLNFSSWYDYMAVFVKDGAGKIPNLA